MEEALQTLANEDEQVKPINNLAVGIAASVVLHLICSVVLIVMPHGPESRQSVTYIDLNLPQAQAPSMTPPAKKPAPVVAPKPEPPVLTEKQPVPDVPKEPAPVEQPKAATEQPVATQPPKVEEKRSATTLGLGLTKGYFKSLAEGESLRPVVKSYFLDMLQGINEKWWVDQQFEGKNIAPLVVYIRVARNGEIVNSEVMISSGNPRYDRAVLAALKAASPLPPLPAEYQFEFFEAPLRLVPPLNLMAW